VTWTPIGHVEGFARFLCGKKITVFGFVSTFYGADAREEGTVRVKKSEYRVVQALLVALLVLVGSVGYSQEGPAMAAASGQDAAKAKAVERARIVPKQMGFDLAKYLAVPLDKNEPAGVLGDSDIALFVVPVALEADWWIVLFLPQNIREGPPICVYLDKRLDVVRGYVIGLPLKQKVPVPGGSSQPQKK
jgi:hypothetical protein